MMPPMEPPAPTDVLRTPEAGGLVIRGGLVRVAGYGLTVVFAAATSVFLLRSLGVERFGVYGVVAALLGIVSSLTEAGLTQVGTRDLPLRRAEERKQLLGTLVAIRIALTSFGVLIAALFALAAGYDRIAVEGTLLAGIGVVLVNTQVTATLPLRVGLRVGTVTFFDVLAQALTCLFVGLLAALGASLLPYFGVQVAVGAILLAGTLAVVGPSLARPALHRGEARTLLREALPLAAAVAMNVVYLRLLVILVSLLENDRDTGLFATSFRVLELLVGLPVVILSVALPVLAVAGAEDRERFRYGFQRLTEVALVISLLEVLLVVVLAAPAIRLVAGAEYADAAPILRIQALSLVPVFVAQALTLGLVSLRRQRSVAVGNALALAAVLVLGLALVPAFGTTGAAAAGVATEAILAVALLVSLRRREPAATPRLGFVWRPLAAAAAGAVPPLALDLSGWIEAPIAAAVFLAVALVVRAVPEEVLPALLAPLRRPR
jgi:O-antigen/teichoic acid export membrane protein